ncbi:MAG: hypothetical protein K6A78_00055 [Prevotella sp.]|nr:hypothetical protein [Prevotella sp.]
MKTKNIIFTALLFLSAIMTGCSPDEYSLGGQTVSPDDLAEGVAFTIEHDANNPNIIYLKSLMGAKYTVLWEHPQGRSQEPEVTLKMPFAGTYTVKFGVETSAGVVFGEPVEFTISDFCAEFISGTVWEYIAGGAGGSKTWVYDNGQYGYGTGEFTYGSPDDNPDLCRKLYYNIASGESLFVPNWDPGVNHTSANFASTMTFDLVGRAGYSYYNGDTGETQEGIFNLNEDLLTLTLVDADLMHPDGWTERRDTWRQNMQIVEIDENHMRVAYTRIPGSWGGEWIEVFNYVTKEWADNYQPTVDNTIHLKHQYKCNACGKLTFSNNAQCQSCWSDDVTLNRTFNDYFEPFNQLTTTYMFADTEPIAWNTLNGSAIGRSAEDYGQIDLSDVIFKFNSSTKSLELTDPSGNATTLTYSLDDNGKMTFSGKSLPWFNVAANSDLKFGNKKNELQVINYDVDPLTGDITDIYIGSKQYDAQGNAYEYLTYHITKFVAGGQESRAVACNSSLLHYGDIEGNGNLRIEIFNCWGSGTADNPPVNSNEVFFKKQMVINFTVSGLGTFDNEVDAFVMISGAELWDLKSGVNDFKFKGDGTYTVTVTAKSPATENLVFCIDAKNAQSQLPGFNLNENMVDHKLTGVTVTINSIMMD